MEGELFAHFAARPFSLISSAKQVDRVETAPIGEYRPNTLYLQLSQPNVGTWRYVFSGTGDPQKGYRVDPRKTTIVDPVGKLEFGIELDQDATWAVWPGSQVALRYYLRTADELAVNDIGRGESLSPFSDSWPLAITRLKMSDGEVYCVSMSAFA